MKLVIVLWTYLYLYHLLGLREKHGELYLTTLEYKYAYQATEDGESWIFRYDYQRDPPEKYWYPRAHLHLSAKSPEYPGAKEFHKLHIPTGRVTIEEVVRHLLQEHAIPAISPNTWQDVLAQTEAAFREIQQRRLMDPDND